MSLAVVNEGRQIGDAVVGSPLGVHGHGRRVGVDTADRVVVLIGVIAHVAGLVGGQLEGDHADGVAVRISVGDGLVAGNAGSAGLVVNGDGNAELLLQCGAESAQAVIRSAAGRPRIDRDQALGGVVRSGRDGSQTQNHGQGNHQSNKLLHNRFLLKKL